MLLPKPFYLIRHGQSRANERRITAGGLFDSPLTNKGRDQAHALRPHLKDNLLPMPSVIYHSTMIRAHDTARILNEELGLEMIADFALREHDLGGWDGLPWEDVIPQLRAKVPPPGGETTERFAERIRDTLNKILKTSDEKNPPMIVAHGGLFHAIGHMYECAIADINNCHMHFFEPMPEKQEFPWHIWQFDIEEESAGLIKRPAPFLKAA